LKMVEVAEKLVKHTGVLITQLPSISTTFGDILKTIRSEVSGLARGHILIEKHLILLLRWQHSGYSEIDIIYV